MMRHHLHMPSYFLGTFTEYPNLRQALKVKTQRTLPKIFIMHQGFFTPLYINTPNTKIPKAIKPQESSLLYSATLLIN